MDLISRQTNFVRAIVKNNKDPQNLRRVKVVVPQKTGEKEETDWIWPISSTQRPPSIGQGVWVSYIDGDPEFPVWLGEFAKRDPNPSFATSGKPFFQGLFSYGSFYSTSTQFIAAESTPAAVTINSTDMSEGVFLQGGSQLHVTYGATYNIQFSLQLHHISGGGGGSGSDVYIWLRKNGSDVPNSSTRLVVPTGTYQVAAWNFLVHLNPEEFAQLYWSTTTVDMRIQPLGASGGGPAVPSAIVTMTQVA